MTKGLIDDWKNDRPRAAYKLPLIVDVPITPDEPDGKRDISEWAAKIGFYQYWLALRSGTTEWNSRAFVPNSVLKTLEHGKYYTPQELNLTWMLKTRSNERLPSQFQFIVEKL